MGDFGARLKSCSSAVMRTAWQNDKERDYHAACITVEEGGFSRP
jgi:hypothetical protein